jgi:acyl dehydratase
VNFSAPYEQLAEAESFVSRGRTVTEADVVAFAALTGDWHPQHADAVWARDSAFGERIAHGLLELSCAAGLVPFDPDRVVALRRVRAATFKRPVRLGATIHVEGRIADVAPAGDDTGLVAVDLDVRDERDRTVIRGQVEVVWRRGDAPAAPPAERTEQDRTVVPL